MLSCAAGIQRVGITMSNKSTYEIPLRASLIRRSQKMLPDDCVIARRHCIINIRTSLPPARPHRYNNKTCMIILDGSLCIVDIKTMSARRFVPLFFMTLYLLANTLLSQGTGYNSRGLRVKRYNFNKPTGKWYWIIKSITRANRITT